MRAMLVRAAGVLVLLVGSACAGQDRSDAPTWLLRREPLVVWVLRVGHAPPPPDGLVALMPPQPRFDMQEVTPSGLGQASGAGGTSASGEDSAKAVAAGARPYDWEMVAAAVNRVPGARVSYFDLYAEDLEQELGAAKMEDTLPDVLVGELPSTLEFRQMERRDGLFVPMSIYADVYPDNLREANQRPFVYVFRDAPHPDGARALAKLVAEWGWAAPLRDSGTEAQTQPGSVAVDVLYRLLHGHRPGTDADPKLAEFSMGQVLSSVSSGVGLTDDIEPKIQVMDELVDGALAAISLRVIVSSDRSFALLHPMVVLRRVADGSWRVVQISFNLRVEQQAAEAARLMHSSPPSVEERKGGVKGVSVASPVDGDKRPAQTELWWDNLGGAGLQVVEWQQSDGDTGVWSDTHLYFVKDMDARLQTREVARFATGVGMHYRWRVWSVGDRGALKLSGWRTFEVLP